MVAAPALSSKPPCRIPSSDPGGQGPSPQAPLPWVTVRVTAASAPGQAQASGRSIGAAHGLHHPYERSAGAQGCRPSRCPGGERASPLSSQDETLRNLPGCAEGAGVEPRASCVPGKCSTLSSVPRPTKPYLKYKEKHGYFSLLRDSQMQPQGSQRPRPAAWSWADGACLA